MKSMNALMDNEQGMEAIWIIQGSLASLGPLFLWPLAPPSTLLFELLHPNPVASFQVMGALHCLNYCCAIINSHYPPCFLLLSLVCPLTLATGPRKCLQAFRVLPPNEAYEVPPKSQGSSCSKP